MFKFDRERWHWFDGLKTVQYLQNLWCYAEYPGKMEDYIHYNLY